MHLIPYYTPALWKALGVSLPLSLIKKITQASRKCVLCAENSPLLNSPNYYKEIKIQQEHTSKSQMEPDMMAHILPIPGLDPLL